MFFLQAEDGIREYDVTGVQTCALPICSNDGKPRYLSLASHLPVIEEWLKAHPEVRLFVVDPISAFMGDGDSHKNAEVRAVLGPLADLAERHRLAVLGITHLTKGQAKAINRIIGSIAFVAAARAAWLIGEDPDTPERRLFLPVKNNLGKAGGLAYRLVGEDQATRIEWDPVASEKSLIARSYSPLLPYTTDRKSVV